LSRDNPAPAAPLALGGGWIGALSRAAVRLDQELFERAARRPSSLLDRAMPGRTGRADHGVLWMVIACELALERRPNNESCH
jgi:hypothetical protein